MTARDLRSKRYKKKGASPGKRHRADGAVDPYQPVDPHRLLKPDSSLMQNRKTFGRPIQSDRNQIIGLGLASLVAGLVIIFNCDRGTNVSASLQIGESHHGWPWVYLKRSLVSQPELYYPRETYSWPYPPVYNESREFFWLNLLSNVVVGLALVIATYYLISMMIRFYDHWRHPAQ